MGVSHNDFFNLIVFSLLGITVSFSSLERATDLVTGLFCIIFRAEADFKVKTSINKSKPFKNTRKKAPAASSKNQKIMFHKFTSYQKYTLSPPGGV